MKKQLTTLMIVLGLATAAIAQDKMKNDQMAQDKMAQDKMSDGKMAERQEDQAVQEASQEGPDASQDIRRHDEERQDAGKDVRRQNEGHGARRQGEEVSLHDSPDRAATFAV